MYIAILGRQPELSMAELESCFGPEHTHWFSPLAATVATDIFTIEQLGGTVKAGRVTMELPGSDWRRVSQEVIQKYSKLWNSHEGKITLGISAYDFSATPREVQKIGITIKQNLKKSGVSLRLLPNIESQLNTATSHHNKLGLSDNKVELLIVRGKSGRTIVAESTGAQNITALAARDQARPKRDAFVGMLPPKLAQIMVNLAAGALPGGEAVSENFVARKQNAPTPRLLDAFCGTGVILQEAALMGYAIYGTDLADKMVDYTKINLAWLKETRHLATATTFNQADATKARWQPPIDLVVSETYLGQPFSAPPSSEKLEEVKRNVAHIFTTFLQNIHPQLAPGTPLCLAVPAWRDAAGHVTRLPISNSLASLGYKRVPFTNISPDELLYYREDQVVARELLVLTRT